MMDVVFALFLAAMAGLLGYADGRDTGRIEYFKGQIECKQAFEIIECKKVKNE